MADVVVDDGLVEFLQSLGATDEQIDRARLDCNLAQLPTDLVLSRDDSLSAVDLAARTGAGVEDVVGLWRILGVAVPDPRAVMFTERDAVVTELALHFMHVGPSANDELFRILGSSLARVAEAAVSLYVQTIEPTIGAGPSAPAPDLEWVRHLAETTSKALKMGDGMGRSSPITCATPSTASAWPRPKWPTPPCSAWRWASWIWWGSRHCRSGPNLRACCRSSARSRHVPSRLRRTITAGSSSTSATR